MVLWQYKGKITHVRMGDCGVGEGRGGDGGSRHATRAEAGESRAGRPLIGDSLERGVVRGKLRQWVAGFSLGQTHTLSNSKLEQVELQTETPEPGIKNECALV